MSYILITPVKGTARSINGVVLTSGVHYMLVRRDQIEVRNALTQLHIEAVEAFSTDKFVDHSEIRKLVEELQISRKQEENESYEDYRRNLYLYAVEVLTSENKEVETDSEPKTQKSTSRKTTTEKEVKPSVDSDSEAK